MADVRYELARLRAGGARPTEIDLHELAGAAQPAGRRVVPLATDGSRARATLAWSDTTDLAVDSWPIERRELGPSSLLAFAACLGCCWTDPSTDPYPGTTVPVAAVLAVLRTHGLDERWAKAALDHDLPALGWIERPGPDLRLGPAVAALPRREVALLRRSHARLPGPAISAVAGIDTTTDDAGTGTDDARGKDR